MKNRSAIVLLLIANSISGIAQGISMLAIPWYFAREDGMSEFGLIYVLTSVISLLWVPYSGTFVDRYNRKHIFLVINTVCGLLLFAVSAWGIMQGALPWYMVAMVFMMTFFNYNIHYPNLYAFAQEITTADNYGKITSMLEIQGQLSSILAGAGAALLLEGTENGVLNVFGFHVNTPFDIAPWAIYEIFTLDAFTYVLAFIVIAFIRYTPIVNREKESGNIFARLKIGYQYLLKNKNTLIFGIASYSVFVVVLIDVFFLGALYVKAHLKESGDVFATSEIYYAMGAVLTGFTIRWIFRKVSIPMSVIIMTIATGVLFAVLGCTNNLFIFYAMLFVLGITNAGTRIQRVTYLFSKIPNQIYGRASSIFFISNILFRIFFLSIFSMPFFHISNHVVYAVAIMSGFLFLSALVLIFYYRALMEDN